MPALCLFADALDSTHGTGDHLRRQADDPERCIEGLAVGRR
jgi:hypothetical protein